MSFTLQILPTYERFALQILAKYIRFMMQIHLKDRIFERAALMLGVDVIIRSDYRHRIIGLLSMLWHNVTFPMISYLNGQP